MLSNTVTAKRRSLVARGESEEVVVAVHNAGSPIPREALGSIFDPLVRSPPEGANPPNSIGLGLFIARAIERAMAARSMLRRRPIGHDLHGSPSSI